MKVIGGGGSGGTVETQKSLSLLDEQLLKATSAELAATLLDAGADINAQDNDGWTPLVWSIATENRPLFDLLTKRGARIDHQTDNGQTPLHYAVSVGCAWAATTLLEKGASLTLRDAYGETALEKARNGGDDEMAALIAPHEEKRLKEFYRAATTLQRDLPVRKPIRITPRSGTGRPS